MVKRLFSVVLLASLFMNASSLFAADAAPAHEVKIAAEAKPSMVRRAVNSVTSTASSAASRVKNVAVYAAGTSSAYATSFWANHKLASVAALLLAASAVAYNCNDSFRSAVREFFGLDDEACRFSPTCDCSCDNCSCDKDGVKAN